MLKNLVLALLPLTLLLPSVKGDDMLTIDSSSIKDASVEIIEADLDIDVDVLLAESGDERGEAAIEACFRRYGYSHRSWGRGYRNSCYNNYYSHCHSYCQRLYSYRPLNYCPPVYRCFATPVYHYYWGCQ